MLSFERLRVWESTVTRVYRAAAHALADSVRCLGGRLPQKFHVEVCADLRGDDLLDLLGLSRDVWLLRASSDGCIIKAASSDLHRRRRNGDRPDRFFGWADLIRYARGQVVCGLPVGLVRWGPGGLWRSFFDDRGAGYDGVGGEFTGWEVDPEVCALYALRDGTLLWTLPGGFCVPFELRLDHADVQVLRERFEEH